MCVLGGDAQAAHRQGDALLPPRVRLGGRADRRDAPPAGGLRRAAAAGQPVVVVVVVLETTTAPGQPPYRHCRMGVCVCMKESQHQDPCRAPRAHAAPPAACAVPPEYPKGPLRPCHARQHLKPPRAHTLAHCSPGPCPAALIASSASAASPSRDVASAREQLAQPAAQLQRAVQTLSRSASERAARPPPPTDAPPPTDIQ